VALDRDEYFAAINYNVNKASEHDANITFWQIVLAALNEEKPLFEGDLEQYRGKERMIRRRIRRNERVMGRHLRRADKLIAKYTKAGGDIHA
jgi:hypothetical protein